MTAHGIRQDDIAASLEISDETLRLHFRREIDIGHAMTIYAVANKLVEAALNGNVQAMIAYLKLRGGSTWAEARPEGERNGADNVLKIQVTGGLPDI